MAAAPPAAALPLPVPAQPDCKFSTIFADASKDPFSGGYGDLLSHFDIDPNNNNANTTPANLRDYIAAAGAQRIPFALGLFVNGFFRVYLCPNRFERALGVPVTSLDSRTFAFDGDLHHNQGLSVEIDNASYNLIANATNVPDIAAITTALAAVVPPVPNQYMLGPYQNGDAGTIVARVRKIIAIPNCYVPLFLAREVTASYFFTAIHPQIVLDGKEQACAAFIKYFQVAITRIQPNNDTSPLDTNAPIAPPRNVNLLDYRRQILEHHFPSMNQSLAILQQNQIAQQLAAHNQLSVQHRVEDEERRIKEKTITVEKWLGYTRFTRLLRISAVQGEADLHPIWLKLANAKKKERLSILQSHLDENRESLGEYHLSFIANAALLNLLESLSYAMVSKDAIETGLNPFFFGDSDMEASQQANARVELMLAGGASPSLADAEAALATKINMPQADGSSRNIRRQQILSMSIFPLQHQFTRWLKSHYEDWESFCTEWSSYIPNPAYYTAAKGILHCKWMATCQSEWFKEQARSPQIINLPDPYEIRRKIEREQPWEPMLSTAFIQRYKILDICGVHTSPPTFGPLPRVPAPPTPHPTPIGNEFPMAGGGGGVGGGGGGGSSGRRNNTSFNTSLFGTYKSNPSRSSEIRRKIRSGEIPALPASKVDGGSVCLAWHTKGQCNLECPRCADHVMYTAEEYQPLVTWCAANYPSPPTTE